MFDAATRDCDLPELYQTEWCPASRRVRQRLTELDVTYVARQVPVEREERTALLARTGGDSIPALVCEDDDGAHRRRGDPLLPGRALPGARRRPKLTD